MRISSALVLLLIVVCTYARSFSAVDIPDPPQFAEKETRVEKSKKSLNSTTQQPITTKVPTQKPTTILPPTTKPYTIVPHTTKPTTTVPPTTKPTTTVPPTTKPTTTVPPTTKPTTTVPPTTKPTTTVPPTTKPTTTVPPTTKPTTTVPPTTKPTTTKAPTSTTLDPWDEFCKEACEEGLAGPECDCPEHPIGRRSVGKPRHRRSTFIDTEETHDSESLKHRYTSKAKPTVNLKVKRLLMRYCKEVCDHGIHNDICKCSGVENKPAYVINDPAYNINGSSIDKGTNSTEAPGAAEPTTKDPLEEFCENACAEGQGTLACNCHDHIVGRRRRSVNTLTGYDTKDFLKTLQSNRLRRIQRSSGHYQDATELENALPRVKLHRDSVQPQDYNVQFPFKTLPEIIKGHKEKWHNNSSP